MIKVIKTEEQEDGGLLIELEIDEDTLKLIVQEWIRNAIIKGLEDGTG